MSFADCIKRATDAKEADAERGKAATELWKEIADGYERMGYSRHQAEAMAGKDAKQILRRNLKRKRHELMRRLETERRNYALAQSTPEASIPDIPLRLLQANLGSKVQVQSVVSTMDSLRVSFNGMIGQFLRHHAPNIVGQVRDKAGLMNVVRELHGQRTGNEMAKAYADSVRDAFERARVMFNSAGGNIGKLDDFGLPHAHDRQKIISQGFDTWSDAIRDRLDWTRIENYATGQPFSRNGEAPPRAVQDGFLREVFNGIVSEGRKEPVWGGARGKALHNRYSESRVLHFQSADDWMDYNRAFGAGDPFSAITGHLHKMARDIAMMRTLGPSHTMGLENAIDHAMKRVEGNLKLEDKLKANAAIARAMLSEISGEANVPYHEGRARFMGGLRQTLSAAHLGSAALLSGSDSVSMTLAARVMGQKQSNPVANHVKLLASSMSREEAARMGYVADTLANSGATLERFLGEAPISRTAEVVNGFVMRAQGLAFWTDYGRIAASIGFEAEISAAKKLTDLSDVQQGILRSRGITDEDWTEIVMPSRRMKRGDGGDIVNLAYWRERALQDGMDSQNVERIYLTLSGLQQEIVGRSIPTVDYEMRARVSSVSGNARPGSVPGELTKSFLSYKSYALAFTGIQMQHIMTLPTPMSRAQYVAAMIAGFTVAGGIGLQLKEIAKGNDPRPMDTWEFWGAAGLQGGGLGIIGDLTTASTTRLGGGLMGYFAGPTVGFFNDAGSLVFGNAKDAMNGDDMNLGRDAVKFAKRYTPGTTLWQTRAAMDRMVWDQLQILLDPEAHQAMRRQVHQQKNDYGNGEWFPSGEPLPSRAPDLGNVITP